MLRTEGTWFKFVIALASACAPSFQPLPPRSSSVVQPVPAGSPSTPVGFDAARDRGKSTQSSFAPAVVRQAGPLVFEAMAPDARWLVVCQAREDTNDDGRLYVGMNTGVGVTGDRLLRYLVLANGEEQQIDDLLAASADGHWLILQKDGRSELIDAIGGARVDLTNLGADSARDPWRHAAHRTFVFDNDLLFYVRASGLGGDVVQRQLSSSVERTLYRSNEPILRLSADPAGKSLVLTVAGPDANGNGRFDWPYALERGPRPCRAPVEQFVAPRLGADPTSSVVIDRTTLDSRKLDGLAGVLGSDLIARKLDGSLVRDRANTESVLANQDCAGRLLWLDPWRDQLLVGCAIPKKSGRSSAVLLNPSGAASLDLELASLAFDEPTHAEQRIVPLYPGADLVLLDLEKRSLHRLQTGDVALATVGTHALIRRGSTLLIYDVETSAEATLPGSVDAIGEVLSNGRLVFASPLLVDVATGQILGSLPGRPLALSSFGQLLLPAVPANANTLAQGPLVWAAPPSTVQPPHS